MKNRWYTSDLHAFHDNIVKYCNRPIGDKIHNEWILDIVNKGVKSTDIITHMGDLVGSRRGYKYADLLAFMKQLEGHWRFIKGNHDNEEQLKSLCKDSGHEYLGVYHEERIEDKSFILFHFPIENWHKKHYGSIHLHGHVHNTPFNRIENRYNVCLDKEHKIYNIEELIL